MSVGSQINLTAAHLSDSTSHSDGTVLSTTIVSTELSPGALGGQCLSSILVCLHGTTVRLLGHHESHQFSVELLNLLYILGLVGLVL